MFNFFFSLAPLQNPADIIESIKNSEQEFEQELEQSYTTMGSNTFKALRRALPMTATKINWGAIKSYSVGKGMK